ncbi:DUF960 family protein [Bacillus coahuilensis]|nr:DUF960 family protein [Bacillus coahuilensis]
MFNPKPVYTTKQAQNLIRPEIIKGMLDSIMAMKKVTKVDYLQTFDVSTNGTTTYITHIQEEPNYRKQLMLTQVNNNFKGKVFIIDDGKCITVMLAEEY